MNNVETHFKLWGRYFGFPDCCIKTFDSEVKEMDNMLAEGDIEGYQEFNTDRLSRSEFRGTGYIPCKCCSKKSKEELVETINNNRKALTPFPERANPEEEEAHMMSIIEELK